LDSGADSGAAFEAADEIRLPAPAKLNLYLHVVGRRADGYHLLDSLVAFAAEHDVLSVRPAAKLSLRISGPFAGALRRQKNNLVLQAARMLADRAGLKAGAKIHLIKNLPVAAGLGGGSADCAAALQALARLWKISIPADEMRTLGLALGADVPICLAGRAAFVGGVGEAIDPAPRLPPAALVLVNPGRPLPTARVFAGRGGDFSGPGRFAGEVGEEVSDVGALARLLAGRANDLTDAATSLVPEIGAVLERLAAEPGCRLARMTGSGASCFGLFDDTGTAERAAGALAGTETGWWVRATRLLTDATVIPGGVIPGGARR
jgi:4-diphosphocytidyl-2-C-methyl-D-erythritol kinase